MTPTHSVTKLPVCLFTKSNLVRAIGGFQFSEVFRSSLEGQILQSNTCASRLLLQLKVGITHAQWCHWPQPFQYQIFQVSTSNFSIERRKTTQVFNLVSTTLIQNQKKHLCVIQLKDHQILKSAGPKTLFSEFYLWFIDSKSSFLWQTVWRRNLGPLNCNCNSVTSVVLVSIKIKHNVCLSL